MFELFFSTQQASVLTDKFWTCKPTIKYMLPTSNYDCNSPSVLTKYNMKVFSLLLVELCISEVQYFVLQDIFSAWRHLFIFIEGVKMLYNGLQKQVSQLNCIRTSHARKKILFQKTTTTTTKSHTKKMSRITRQILHVFF